MGFYCTFSVSLKMTEINLWTIMTSCLILLLFPVSHQAVQPSTGDIVYDEFEDGPSFTEVETRFEHIGPEELLLPESVTVLTDNFIRDYVTRVQRCVSMSGSSASVLLFVGALPYHPSPHPPPSSFPLIDKTTLTEGVGVLCYLSSHVATVSKSDLGW